MLLDPTGLTDNARLQADVYVIGAGAAGITLARSLARGSARVLLLEGGGFNLTPESQDLYTGTVAMGPGRVDDGYLESSRLRYFGGSTNHWAGWCRPLDARDFGALPWVPHSGWPLDRATLEPWYRQAVEVVEVPPFEPGVEPRVKGRPLAPLSQDARMETRIFRFSPPTRFGVVYREELVTASRVELLLGANVTALRTDAGGERVDHVEVLCAGRRLTAHAKLFVLACGGIENARLLLLSDQDHPAGLGNGRDQVGRYFMEHITVRNAGRPVILHPTEEPEKQFDLYLEARGGKKRTEAVFELTPALRDAEELLGIHLQIRGRDKPVSASDEVAARTFAAMAALDGDEPHRWYVPFLSVRVEMAPDPSSRVVLGEDRDALGQRRVRLEWKIGELERRTLTRGLDIFAEEFGAAGIGRLQLRFHPSDPWDDSTGGMHHMGTTRMHVDPAQGVVDDRCRVHGVPNLYVAGSSFFPTCGNVNPTLTIVALALRIADDLTGELG